MALMSTTTKRNAMIISLIGTGHGMSHFYGLALPPLFPLIKTEFHVSYAELGLLVTMLNVTGAIVQLPVGFLVDRIGGRILLPVGLGLMALPFLALGMASNYWVIVALMAVAGVGTSVFHPVDYAILNATIDEKFLGRAFSLHTLTGNIGFMLAPGTMILLASLWNWRIALVIAGCIGLAFMVLMIACGRLLHSHQTTKSTEAASSPNPDSPTPTNAAGIAALMMPQVLLMFVFFVLITIMTTGIQTFSVTTLDKINGVPLLAANTILTSFLIASAVGLVAGGVSADKWRRHTAIAVSALLLIGGLLIVIGTVSLPVFVMMLAFIVMGFMQGLIRPARDMIVRSITPKDAIGKVFGMLSTAMSVGHAITPVCIGWLIDRGHANLVFYILAAVMLLAIPTLTLAQNPALVRGRAPTANKAAAE